MFNTEEKKLVRLACLAAVAELDNNNLHEKAISYQAIADKLMPMTEEEELIGY